MKKLLVAAVFCLALAPLAHAGPPADWKPPARKDYDVTKDKVLYEVGYAHLDTQWQWTYLDTIRDYIPNTMTRNFALLDKYPDYVFSFTGSNRYKMMKEYYPANYEKLKQYINAGRWRVAGSSVEEEDVNVSSAESILRHVLYGNHYFRKEFGAESVDVMIPDCFGFPASLPSIIAHCGLKGFSTQKLTWGSPIGIPFTVGRWYGPDGRYVTAALDPGSYGATVSSDLSNDSTLLSRINNLGATSGIFVDYRYYGTGDVGGSPTEGSVQAVSSSVRGTGPITVVSAPADQIFKDLTPAQTAKLPSYTGDLELTQHSAGSITSEAYMKRWNRKNELLADAAERAAVGADWLGGMKYPVDFMDETWRLILGAQFHDILPGTSLPKAYEFSWNDEVVAMNRSASVLANGAGAVIRAMDTTAVGVPVVVYNPLSVWREDAVEATVRYETVPSAVRVYGPNGNEVPSQITGTSGSAVKVVFLAQVPSVGFATYDVRPSTTPCDIDSGLSVTTSGLENQRYRVTLDGNGDVSAIYDKANARQMLSGPARLAFKYEQPSEWPAWNIDWADQSAPPTGYVTGPAAVRIVENGPARVALEVTRYSRGSKFVQVIRLSPSGAANRVEFDNAINWNERKTTLKTEFSLAVANSKATYNMGLGTIQRATNEPGRYENPSHQWFDLTASAGDYGVSVLEDCKFGSDKPDDHTLRLTLLRTPGANSYVDQATQDVGQHRVLYALEGHAGDWRGKTPWEADRLNQPLTAFQAPAHTGTLGRNFTLLAVSSSQVGVVALKKAQDTDEVIIRLQELSGAPASVSVAMAAPIVSAREVTGQEDTLGAASVVGGALQANFTAYSPKTFALRLAAPTAPQTAPACRQITLPYDITAVTSDGVSEAKGADGLGYSFPAEMFPSTIDMGGVAFRLAKATAGAKTALSCQGQTIPLPTGPYRKLYLLASASNGDKPATFLVDGKPVTLTVQDWGAFVGQWDNRYWSAPASAPNAPRLDGGIYGLKPAYIKRAPIAFAATHRHTASGANDYYAYAYMFEYEIDAPAGAHTLTLPNAPTVNLYALTAAAGTNDDAQPARYLYDAFDTADGTPSMSPAPGAYANTIQVSLSASLYDPGATVRYTTDGSDPTAASPAYTSPITVGGLTTIKARGFHADGTAGAIASGVYNVVDTTAPALLSVQSVAGSTLVVATFSEPLLASTAAVASNYKIPGLTVAAAALEADGYSVDLTVTPAPAAAQTYALTVTGVKDRSTNGNTLNMSSGMSFTPAAAVITVAGGSTAASPSVAPTGFTVTVTGAPAPTASQHGTALSFNGTSDAITVDSRSTLNPTAAISMGAWIRATNWNGNRRILQKGNSDTQYRLLAENGSFKFDLTGVGTVTCTLPSTGAWHYVAGTYDGAMMRLYVDGAVAASAAASGSIATTSDSLNIGTKNTSAPSGDHFIGLLADVRIYNQALSAAHIRAIAGL
ncbi:MAG TPA: glycoside hydrolase family 38 C-terminal domain-containing protein [Armatimonadota bacterium]|jgi:alpha-mannosidase